MAPASPMVMVVDDDISVRAALGRLLRSAGYAYKAFESAEKFLAASVIDAADCLLVDIHMPGMRGSDLQAYCARHHPSLPIIVITAFEDPEAERRCLANGAVAFLHKPFDGEVLLHLIEQASAARHHNQDNDRSHDRDQHAGKA